MANVIKIKKGLDINLMGKAPMVDVSTGEARSYGIVPDHYSGLVPRLEVQVGDHVLAGDPVLYQKDQPSLKITAQ